MPIPGDREYQRREYCRAVTCPIQKLLEKREAGSADYDEARAICQTECIHTTYEFHHWLIERGYLIVRKT